MAKLKREKENYEIKQTILDMQATEISSNMILCSFLEGTSKTMDEKET